MEELYNQHECIELTKELEMVANRLATEVGKAIEYYMADYMDFKHIGDTDFIDNTIVYRNIYKNTDEYIYKGEKFLRITLDFKKNKDKVGFTIEKLY